MGWGQSSEVVASRGMLGLVDEPSDEVQYRASLTVVRAGATVDERRVLLQMLGLLPADGEWEQLCNGRGVLSRRLKETIDDD